LVTGKARAPVVPIFLKKALLAVIVATPGVNVATSPVGSGLTSSLGMIGGVAWAVL
jgi:hypothetical protein